MGFQKKFRKFSQFFEVLPKEGWKLHKFSETEALIHKQGHSLALPSLFPICPVCAVANKLAKRRIFDTNHLAASC